MHRRKFVKALAALPAVVGGLISIPKTASQVRVAPAADAVGISADDGHQIDDLDVTVRIEGKEIVGTIESFELDFRRDLTFGKMDIHEARVSKPGFCEMEISMKVDDQFSDQMSEIVEDLKLRAERRDAWSRR